MNPIDFIIDLQEQNQRSLIPIKPSFIRNFIDRYNFYLIVRDEQQADVGYLIHSRPRPGIETHLIQICIAKHARKRGHGRRLIEMLITRCQSYDVVAIITQCPAHLKAAAFFPHLNFIRTTHRRDRRTLTKYIDHYSMAIEPNATPQNRPRWQSFREMGPKSARPTQP